MRMYVRPFGQTCPGVARERLEPPSPPPAKKVTACNSRPIYIVLLGSNCTVYYILNEIHQDVYLGNSEVLS